MSTSGLSFERMQPLAKAVAANPRNKDAVKALQAEAGMIPDFVDGIYGPGTTWVTAAILGPHATPKPVWGGSAGGVRQWLEHLATIDGPPPFLSSLTNGLITLPTPPPQSHATYEVGVTKEADRSVLGVPRADERPVAPPKPKPEPEPEPEPSEEDLDPPVVELDEVIIESDEENDEPPRRKASSNGTRKKGSIWPWVIGAGAFGVGLFVFSGKKRKR